MKRIAVINRKKCRPDKCDQPCIRFCPRVRSGDNECVVLDRGKIAIAEGLCVGCGICAKKCPFNAITIINLATEPKNMVHQYGKNAFRLYGLPAPEKGKVIGLLGANGTGKTTALKILSGQEIPNLGKYNEKPLWDNVIEAYRSTSLQNYLKELSEGKVKTIYKPQQVDAIPRVFKGTVRALIKDERKALAEVAKKLDIANILDRELKGLSGGELQRVAIAAAVCRKADVYYIDEPSSFLDVHQRLAAARTLRELAKNAAVIVVEHDLATLDFLADHVHIVYGSPGVYGVVSNTYATRRGINSYLNGMIVEENVRFRDHALEFRTGEQLFRSKTVSVEYSDMDAEAGKFKLTADAGNFFEGEVIGVFGANALGKTTFARVLAGELKAKKGKLESKITVSYKPQYIKTSFVGSVSDLLSESCYKFGTNEFKIEIAAPLGLDRLMDENVSDLSGGELQRVAVAICLAQDAELYLLDEPSAYLDVEERLNLAKVIRNFSESGEKTCLVIDHDIMLLNYIADRAVVFLGEPAKKGHAHAPAALRESMNVFLKELDVTFRRDPDTKRPRANKPGSQMDSEQKGKGTYYV